MTQIHEEIIQDLDAYRERLAEVTDTFTIADFVRLLSKFFAGLVVLEKAFERRFPKEFEAWSREFYGEDM